MGRLIEEDEAKRDLGDYYHHKTEIQHEALQEALESYVSPITMAVHDMGTQIVKEQERMLLKELRSLEIHVDKDELIKALAYDRRQYDLGYADGKMDANAELIRCKDCDNCMRTELYDGQRWYYCMRNRCVVKDDDFCSYAEPKVAE